VSSIISIDRTGSLTGHGILCDGSTHDLAFVLIVVADLASTLPTKIQSAPMVRAVPRTQKTFLSWRHSVGCRSEWNDPRRFYKIYHLSTCKRMYEKPAPAISTSGGVLKSHYILPPEAIARRDGSRQSVKSSSRPKDKLSIPLPTYNKFSLLGPRFALGSCGRCRKPLGSVFRSLPVAGSR
jgi:hypothetical protein